MLAVLLFAGLAAAAILPAAFDGLVDDDDPLNDGAGATGGKAATLPGDGPADDGVDDGVEGHARDNTGNDLSEDEDDGTDHEIPVEARDAVLGDFDAARDTCTITTDTWDSEFSLAEDPSGKGAMLCFTSASGEMTRLHFPDLGRVPVEAIALRIDAGEGSGPTVLPLAEVFAAADEISPASPADVPEDFPGTVDPFAPLAPIAPDLPDGLPVPLSGVTALAPVDPDLPDLPPDDPSDTGILAPERDDASGQGPDGDTTSGHEPSLIHVDPKTGLPIAVLINDFGAHDLLAVTLSPSAAKAALDITVAPDEAGTGSVVLIDGLPVATLPGAAGVQPSQIRVTVSA
ncbi:hypothetical protein ACRDNQ_08945 [Palleronia sp. KMU-117]|uniref:hypothetical protein n=1 Tax=Palleronia sp. KMU-117 TaxID=3434108 RepID=UPI003D75E092